MWKNPTSLTGIVGIAKNLDCCWLGAVSVKPESAYDNNNCHNNVMTHVSIYGGEHAIGYYFIEGFDTVQAIRHSVWYTGERLIDITPYTDNRDYIIFGKSRQNDLNYDISNCYIQSLDKYLGRENSIMYYVYQLIDPRDGQPFYVGKGQGDRAKTHLTNVGKDRNQYKDNKIAAIRSEGLEPQIEYIAENIIDENLAYNIEAQMISHYGRKGYEENGILTNVCADNRPPNHKGKTYEEIYGPEKAKHQREMRSRLQKERGGYGPKQHSRETRELFSKLTTGVGNPMYGKHHSDQTKRLISEANRKYTGKNNKKSKCYRLISPQGEEIILWGGEAAKYCEEHDLSYSTLKMQIQKGWGIPKKGKTRGWKFEEINRD
jgi:hypothetical protein